MVKRIYNEKIFLQAIKENNFDLIYIKNQDKDICLAKVKKDGLTLQFIKDQDKRICLEAVKNNSHALEYVKNQDKEICLEAVKKEGLTLKYVKKQDKEICLEAIKQNGRALQFVKNLNLIEIPYTVFKCSHRTIYAVKFNETWKFSIGCQINISKNCFIERIYNEDGGLENNPHRQEYLDILKEF